MVKQIIRSQLSLYKQTHVFVKFAVSFILLGLAFCLFSSYSFTFSEDVDSPPPLSEDTSESPVNFPTSQTPILVDFPENETQASHNVFAKCDIFSGDWIPNPSAPSYTNDSCPFIEDHQNCMRNGRPDSQYLHWRWSPRECWIPKFNPLRFLDLMRNKSWAFVGDSIQRNHVQSLLCTLSQVEQAVEIYHDEEYRSKRWHFPSHNFTLSVIWTPFLVKAAIFEDMNGVSTSEIQLHLDKIDQVWTDQYSSLDYIVISGGKWFFKTAIYYENDTIVGCHYCPGNNLTELGFDYAYRKALGKVFDFITTSRKKPFIFLRTTTPDHFENGEWFSGGYCNRTVPFKEGEVGIKDVDSVMRNIELEEFGKAVKSKVGLRLKLLDTTGLSLLRPDGHPGPFRKFHPFAEDKEDIAVQNDCLHWCLPGPIDSWNDLILEMLINGERYR